MLDSFRLEVTPYLSLFGYYTRTYDYQPAAGLLLWNKQALNAGFNWDFKSMLPKSLL